ncbi:MULTISPECIES: hypothetical protein [Gammaproteobacteria]|nr:MULTISPECIES: hypothetical protein [Gammaproteobacteria]
MSLGPVIFLVALPVAFIALLAFWLIHGIRKAEAKRNAEHNSKKDS